jgi:hypothetical protein
MDIWQTFDATPEEIQGTIQLHRCLESPKYCLALRYTQILLEEYFTPKGCCEITYRDLIQEFRDRKVPESFNVVQLTIPLLIERDIKVWR